jgi:hypothetical protein
MAKEKDKNMIFDFMDLSDEEKEQVMDGDHDWKEHWVGMPEFVQEDKPPYKKIFLNFRNEEDYKAFAKLIGQNLTEKTKFYQAGTSEMFGASKPPQNEKTEFYPRSPYAAAKVYAHWVTVNYREAYDIFACNGILFNHESPIRGETFVTKKIVTALCKIVNNISDKLFLGNLYAAICTLYINSSNCLSPILV